MLRERMAGICDTVESFVLPTFLAFQEVTPNIRALLASMAPWWGAYSWSPEPPPNVDEHCMLGCLPSSPLDVIFPFPPCAVHCQIAWPWSL